MTLHFMSDKELSRVEILRDLTAGRLTVSAASELLGLERRQVLRLSKAYQQQGPTAHISKKRGQPRDRQTPSSVKAEALAVIRERYADSPRPCPTEPATSSGASLRPRCWRTSGWPASSP